MEDEYFYSHLVGALKIDSQAPLQILIPHKLNQTNCLLPIHQKSNWYLPALQSTDHSNE